MLLQLYWVFGVIQISLFLQQIHFLYTIFSEAQHTSSLRPPIHLFVFFTVPMTQT